MHLAHHAGKALEVAHAWWSHHTGECVSPAKGAVLRCPGQRHAGPASLPFPDSDRLAYISFSVELYLHLFLINLDLKQKNI